MDAMSYEVAGRKIFFCSLTIQLWKDRMSVSPAVVLLHSSETHLMNSPMCSRRMIIESASMLVCAMKLGRFTGRR